MCFIYLNKETKAENVGEKLNSVLKAFGKIDEGDQGRD